MNHTHKLMARTVVMTEIGSFALADGENLDERAAAEIVKAGEAGMLNKMATRVGLPSIAVTEIGDGEGLSGAEAITSLGIYAPDGSPLAQRSFRIDQLPEGHHVVMAIDDTVGEEIVIGAFPDQNVAESVAVFWRNGHLRLPS